MKQTMTKGAFIDAFLKNDTYKSNFSIDGLIALYEYFEEYEQETGEEINFDMVAICCDYSEYSSLEEYNEDYSKEYETIDEIKNDTFLIPISKINYKTLELENSEKFIIQQY